VAIPQPITNNATLKKVKETAFAAGTNKNKPRAKRQSPKITPGLYQNFFKKNPAGILIIK
jgi:hypothetical protein